MAHLAEQEKPLVLKLDLLMDRNEVETVTVPGDKNGPTLVLQGGKKEGTNMRRFITVVLLIIHYWDG